MKEGCLALVIIIGIFVLGFGLYIGGNITSWVDNGVQTAHKEFDPSRLLEKYEWFKDASAQLDKKQADIRVFEARIADMRQEYGVADRSKWDRTDKETMNQWQTEIAGIRASYNLLSAEYNAAMAKFNWKFTNAGDLPPGADRPLPREYKPYEEGK